MRFGRSPSMRGEFSRPFEFHSRLDVAAVADGEDPSASRAALPIRVAPIET
jgi:hypothetical protein